MTDPELLAALPHRRVAHELDNETGRVVLLSPRFRWRWLERLMAPSPDKRYVRIFLDDLGSFVWQHLDGETPLGDLATALCEAFPQAGDPKGRLCVFARQLAGTGLIGFTQAPERPSALPLDAS